MGFWGTLAGIGKAAAGAIPGAGPLIGMGIDVAQGVIGSKASKNAAEKQAAAAREIATSARNVSGTAATDITNAGAVTIDQLLNAGNDAAGNMRTATDNAMQGVRRVGEEAAAGVRMSADEANGLLRSIYGDSIGWLDPYRQGGATAFQAASEMATNPAKFTAADMELDPGYQFRLAEGQKALERSAAARGGSQSGATLKSLARYSQGVASDEYSKAFDRFQQERNTRFSMLSNLTGTGLRATEDTVNVGSQYAARAAGNVMDAGTYGGNVRYRAEGDAAGYGMQGTDAAGRYLTSAAAGAGNARLNSIGQAGQFRMQGEGIAANAIAGGANAQAAGIMGSANAWTDTLGGIGQKLQANPWMTKPAPGKKVINAGSYGVGDEGDPPQEAQPFMRLPTFQPQQFNEPWGTQQPPYYARPDPTPPIQFQGQGPAAQTPTPAPREQVSSSIKFAGEDELKKGGK